MPKISDGLVQLNGKAISLESIMNCYKEGLLEWSLTAQLPSQPWKPGVKLLLSSKDCSGQAEAVDQGYLIRYSRLSESVPFSKIQIEMRILETASQKWDISLHIQNHNEQAWYIREVVGVKLSGIQASGENSNLYWPNGLGQRFRGFQAIGSRSMSYPSGTGTMPWFALACENSGGLYFGTHDPDKGKLDIHANHNELLDVLDVSVKHHPYIQPGGSWNSPTFVIQAFQGTWHEAAQIYRSWYDSHASIITPPQWVRRSSGWLLSVMKQQNGEVMWDYHSGIDQLCQVAEERGLDTLGLFGWAHGGHDRCFPDFIPDQLMGGKEALRKALGRAKERGMRTILYANGVIMDLMTEFYRYHGNDAALLLENQELQVSSVRKFRSATPVPFAMGCTGSDVWQNRMLELAIQAYELGADGILFDQIGVYGPDECHNPNHKHKTPATAYTTERSQIIHSIATHMRSLSPDFAIMTEGIHDSVLSGISYVHGWGCGFRPEETHASAGEEPFPEMFRYTFPELPMTQRHPTAMMDRYYANFAVLYGLRFELETRYRADVQYLLQDKLPESEDYEDVVYYPPDHELMRSIPPAEAKQYLRQVIEFCKKYSDYLWEGRFLDTTGFELIGLSEGLTAKAYAAGDRIAVLVWNSSSTELNCSIRAGRRSLFGCADPDGESVDAASPIPPQSVRLYLFQ
ncbi:hypothetical protein SY83_22055 [Paenibacillus swuensis]|uniref:DUF6259 domain-containing protein n=1 Tax=Paenibacillus swuensis TaxID=1178515 RepID=A0A172TNB9_9BACL|nr:DUF6259 domain-containing protein [Paenibacillus swuensis]ANE48520.1 hypothetical protein SY83_22055 [Paenibacillus swuensis]